MDDALEPSVQAIPITVHQSSGGDLLLVTSDDGETVYFTRRSGDEEE